MPFSRLEIHPMDFQKMTLDEMVEGCCELMRLAREKREAEAAGWEQPALQTLHRAEQFAESLRGTDRTFDERVAFWKKFAPLVEEYVFNGEDSQLAKALKKIKAS